jgi:HPr kinase/phosphorylase
MSSDRSKGKDGPEAGAQLVHGSVVSLAGRGMLILGASGSGKSALALRLIGRGAALVADDRAVPESPLTVAVDLDRPPAARMPQPVTFACLGLELELIPGREVPDIDLMLTIYVQNGRALPE